MISASTTLVAVRKQGVCRGTLWRQEAESSSSGSSSSQQSSSGVKSSSGGAPSSSSSSIARNSSSTTSESWSSAESEYCCVTLNWLICYESFVSYLRGDAPVRLYRIVGASPCDKIDNASGKVQHAFRLVTNQGTQLFCQAVTSKCREHWLATLTAGLELAFLSSSLPLATTPEPVLRPPAPQVEAKRITSSWGTVTKKRYCCSCGALEHPNTKPIKSASPVAQYGFESRSDLCKECFIAQGLLDHLEFVKACMAGAQQEHEALVKARILCYQLVTPKNTTTLPTPTSTKTTTTTTTKPTTKPATTATTTTKPATTATTTTKPTTTPVVVISEPVAPPPASAPPPPPPFPPVSTTITTTNTADDRNSDSSNESWTNVDKADIGPDDTTTTTTTTKSAPSLKKSDAAWIHISPTSKSTAALLKALRTDKQRLGAWMRVSPFLQSLSEDLLEGRIGVVDFLEQLDEAVGQAEETMSLTALKKQAFKVAGDMGTAMKLLLDHALPKHSPDNDPPTETPAAQLQTLQCLLEFFLDLCQDGELSSVAFYWPQLCHLHLCMLPPDNALAVARVDLMEDFLLTVATKYSVRLALELVWSHSADLEESLLQPGTASPVCRARRFAVLRFVCELESLLFGHEDGWGGGSVTLGKMLSATGDQLLLLRRTITQIQHYRNSAVCQLTQHHSVRRELYRRRKEINSNTEQTLLSPEQMVQEKLRIAKNADYFTSHLNFTKRVCDIAEKLRFMDLRKRAEALQEELSLLNSSGAMGGDPLNRTRDAGKEDSFIRIVRVPSTEGHVFRSKERTPVLLLVELVDEGAEGTDEGTDRSRLKLCGVHNDDDGDGDDSDGDSDSGSEDDESSNVEDGAISTGDTEEVHSPISHQRSPSMDEIDNKRGGGLGMDDSHRSSSRRSIVSVTSGELEGASEDNHRQHMTTALKRFDGSTSAPTPNTPKRVVDAIITNVMVEQCNLTEVSALDPIHLKGVAGLDPDTIDEEGEKLTLAVVSAQSEEGLITTTPNNAQSRTVVGDTSSDFVEIPSVPSPRTSGVGPRRMFKNSVAVEMGEQTNNDLAPTGDIRREVLNVIMMRGRKERNSIAAGTADSAQRSLKELETKRATALLLGIEDDTTDKAYNDTDFEQLKSTAEKLASLDLRKGFELDDLTEKPSEQDEVMEAVRLLLIQNRVVQGHLSPADAAKVLQHVSLSRVSSGTNFDQKGSPMYPGDIPTIDAGDLDPRLAGCGPLPPAVLQALTLWKGEMVTNGELLELVKKDIEFVRHSVLLESESVDKLKEDSAFWGRFAFGERWAEKKARISASSPQGSHPGWDLVGIIVKSNDDLRQEAFIMQLIELCQEAFEIAGLELWVSSYRILATGRSTGIIEMVRNAMSFDALKKRPGYGKGGLREHLQRMTEYTADPGSSFKSAQQNFVRSLAAYSLISYFFMIKDRHNGNLLLDTAGHVIHIDFGFVFGVAPGGSFSLEMSTPFKLTEEMLEVMGGLHSPLFSDFVTLFCCGFLALQSYSDTFFTLVEITSRNSTFKCFEGQNREEILSKLRERFCPNLNKEETIAFALDLIKQATSSYGTRQYDLFQYLTQGVAA